MSDIKAREISYLPPTKTGLRGKCPRCGDGDLFAGFLKVAEKCTACDLDFSFSDSGDGPAFFVMSGASLAAMGFVLWMEFSVGAPYWLNGILSVGFLLLISILPLRPLKGLMIAQQYVKNAHQGELTETPQHDAE
ncbi:MAG: DUF983 domain-containing protein [Pseudomonadota bacterium]